MEQSINEFEFIADKRFPKADLALRKGIHICEDDIELYSYLTLAREPLVRFYERFGVDLIYDPEGYVYLVAKDGVFRRQRLRDGEMLVGMALALHLTDPKSVRQKGVLEFDQFVSQLKHLIPKETLTKSFIAATRKGKLTDQDEIKIKESVARYLRTLSSLGFINFNRDGKITPKKAIFRFAARARNAGLTLDQMEDAGLIKTGSYPEHESVEQNQSYPN